LRTEALLSTRRRGRLDAGWSLPRFRPAEEDARRLIELAHVQQLRERAGGGPVFIVSDRREKREDGGGLVHRDATHLAAEPVGCTNTISLQIAAPAKSRQRPPLDAEGQSDLTVNL
jgi:hypothetical protein